MKIPSDDSRVLIAKGVAELIREKLPNYWIPYRVTLWAKRNGDEVIIEDIQVEEIPR